MSSCTNQITLYQGDTWVFPITVFNPANSQGVQTPLDLTGYTPSGFVLVGNKTTPITVSIQSSNNLLTSGQFQLVVSANVTSTIPGDAPGSTIRPVRIRAVLTDAAGNAETITVIPIHVLVA